MITNRDHHMSGPWTFEEIATIFYKQTGFVHPGKDDARSSHTREQRIDAWEKWLDKEYKHG